MSPRILVDCDGVLSAFHAAYLEIVYRVTGRQHTLDHITEWSLKDSLGLSETEYSRVNGFVSGDFAANLDPLPGAIDAVAKLSTIADLYIVTSPWDSNPTWTYDREQWLKRHFGIPHSRVIHTSAKELIQGDVLVDDRFETCCKWRDAHPGKTAVLWEQPWNRNCAWAGVLTNSWDRLVSIVESVSK